MEHRGLSASLKKLNYSGPYPVAELKAARQTFINAVNANSSAIFKRIKLKCGILSNRQKKINHSDVFTVPAIMTQLPQRLPEESTTNMGSHNANTGVKATASITDNLPVNDQIAEPKTTPAVSPSIGHSATEQATSYESVSSSNSMAERDSTAHGVKRPLNIDDEEAVAPVKLKHKKIKKFTCYKCDLCDFIAFSSSAIQSHLKIQQHYSASRVLANKVNDTFEAEFLLKPTAIIDKNMAFKSCIPMCPACHSIHKDIYQCAMHYQLQHESGVHDCYSLANVIDIDLVKFNKNYCTECQKTFTKPYELHSHWKEENHYPYKLAKENEIVVAFCVYCDKIYYNANMCKNHVEILHQKDKSNFGIRFVYLENPSTQLKLLPQKITVEAHVAQDLMVLKTMRRTSKHFCKSKNTTKKIKKQMKYLKNMSVHKFKNYPH